MAMSTTSPRRSGSPCAAAGLRRPSLFVTARTPKWDLRLRNEPCANPRVCKMANDSMSPSIANRGYAHPESLVDTAWVAEHLQDASVCLVESDEDVLLYEMGHIPGAVKVDWHADLQHPLQRDYLDAESFAELMRAKGIRRDTLVVFYGDKNNWWATYALWVFRLFGHQNVKIMDGGRKKWEDEGRPMTADAPDIARSDYPVADRDDEAIRAFREDVLEQLE